MKESHLIGNAKLIVSWVDDASIYGIVAVRALLNQIKIITNHSQHYQTSEVQYFQN
jgi:hypothetical protein